MIDLSNIFVHGRYLFDDFLHIYNTASGIEFNASTKKVLARMKTISNQKSEAWMRLIIDNDFNNPVDIKISEKEEDYLIYQSEVETFHNFKLLKASEAIESYVDILNIEIDGCYLDKPKYDKTFLVYGDSTVSGYGNLGSVNDIKTLFDTDGLNGYAYLTAKHFNATMNSVNGSGWGLVFSPWTTPKRRPLLNLFSKVAPLSDLEYDLSLVNPTICIISLGTNDSYYIIEGEEGKTRRDLEIEFKDSYHKLLNQIKSKFGDIPIVMVYGVMKERHNYELMKEVYLDNKDSFNLYEALIEGDGMGVSAHPSITSHKEISTKLIKIIEEILNER